MAKTTKTVTTNKYDFGKDVQKYYSKKEKRYKAINGEEYVFKIKNRLKHSEKQLLLDNFNDTVRECENKGEKIDKQVLFLNLIVKYFTNVFLYEDGKEIYTSKYRSVYKKTLEELKIMEELMNLELYKQILSDIDVKEIAELNLWIKNVSKNMLEINEYVKKQEEQTLSKDIKLQQIKNLHKLEPVDKKEGIQEVSDEK